MPGQAAALRGGLSPLPFARAEAKKVAKLFPGAVGLAGPAAREAVVKQQMGHYQILHFATHGILNAENGLLSWLLLAPEKPGSPEDGRLEAREIAEMRLGARLATLSACETGEGQRSGGEGLLGLTWAFQAAGCPSVVASQWMVNDEATAKLMTRFYQGIRAELRKDEALRQAMQAIRRESQRAAPFWWAGFQVIGDTTPLAAR